MNRIFCIIGTLVVLSVAAEAAPPRKALCPVCACRGETELEKVEASTTHDGKAYHFCSKNCKKAFDKYPTTYLPPEFPRPVPRFSVETLEGESVDLENYAGKLVILDFWATWCKPCVDMMPSLEKVYESYADKGVVVMGISIDEGKDRVKKIRKFVDKVGVSYPVFSDAAGTPAWHTLGIKAIPALFLIDQGRQIVAQWQGNVDHKVVEKEIQKHLP
ncbi:MAG: hypothetical protein CME19_02005 [Gemmatimonadetes bacterium]|nr:hypothetical protein [Gemmatimonadota bacterium]